MTANVAQVVLTDEDWTTTVAAARTALRHGGRLLFESRRPERQAWREWTRESSSSTADVPGIGPVRTWTQVTDVRGDLVSFRWTFEFARDGAVLTSDSTLRFRGREELENSLAAAGFTVDDVRDAPDRPGLECVVVAGQPG